NIESISNIKEPSNSFVNKNRHKSSIDDLFSSKCKRSKDIDKYNDLFKTKDINFSVEMKNVFIEDIKEKK
ncbi:726_t:CDS:1, partial [Dentiscutata heterogama]